MHEDQECDRMAYTNILGRGFNLFVRLGSKGKKQRKEKRCLKVEVSIGCVLKGMEKDETNFFEADGLCTTEQNIIR